MKKSTVWAWYLVALLSGMGFVYFSRPGVGTSLLIVSLLVALAVVTRLLPGRGE